MRVACRCKSLEVNLNAIQVQLYSFPFLLMLLHILEAKVVILFFFFSSMQLFPNWCTTFTLSTDNKNVIIVFSSDSNNLFFAISPYHFNKSRSYLVYLTFPNILHFLIHISSSIFQVCLMQETKFSLQFKYSWSGGNCSKEMYHFPQS